MADTLESETNITSVHKISLEILSSTIIANVYWLIFGLFSTAHNALLIFAMKFSGRKWDNFRINTIHLGFADMIVGVVQTCIGIKRLYLTACSTPETSTPERCSVDMGAVIFGLQVSVSQTFCLATDRFVAVVFPLFYRNHWSINLSNFLNFVMWGASVFITVIGVIWGVRPDPLVPVCTMSSVFTESFFQGFIFYLAVYVVSIFAFYMIIVCVVKKRLLKARKIHLNVISLKMEMETHVLDSLKYIVILFVITWLLASVAADCLALFAPLHYSRIIIPYLVGLTGLNGALNFPIYVWKLADIRADFIRLIHRKIQVGSTMVYQPNAGQPTCPPQAGIHLTKQKNISHSPAGSPQIR